MTATLSIVFVSAISAVVLDDTAHLIRVIENASCIRIGRMQASPERVERGTWQQVQFTPEQKLLGDCGINEDVILSRRTGSLLIGKTLHAVPRTSTGVVFTTRRGRSIVLQDVLTTLVGTSDFHVARLLMQDFIHAIRGQTSSLKREAVVRILEKQGYFPALMGLRIVYKNHESRESKKIDLAGLKLDRAVARLREADVYFVLRIAELMAQHRVLDPKDTTFARVRKLQESPDARLADRARQVYQITTNPSHRRGRGGQR